MFKTFLSASALCLGLAGAASAANFSFSGTFTNDNDVQLITFSVGVTSTVTLQAFSYGGGTQADGTVVSEGGFDNILTLFDAAGDFLDSNDDGGLAQTDSVTGNAFDSDLEIDLDAGTYTVAVTQYDNFEIGNLSDGFIFDGPGNENFTDVNSCSNGIFCDVDGNNRTGAWAFDVLNVDIATTPAPVPLPAGMPLLLAGAGAIAVVRRLKK